MQPAFYDHRIPYGENEQKGPVVFRQNLQPKQRTIIRKQKFLDFEVNIPFGIPAGPLLNSQYLKAAFEFGFDVNYYKTRRTVTNPTLPFPNVLFLKDDEQLNADEKIEPLVVRHDEPESLARTSITNSFGNPSQEAHIWQEDMRKAVSHVGDGQLLIGSIVGTIQEGFSEEDYYDDFAKGAKMITDTGVKVVEVNLSCPNVSGERFLCFNPDAVEAICQKVKEKIGDAHLLAKFGYFAKDQEELLTDIMKKIQPFASGIAVINGIPAPVVDESGKQALPGPESRLTSGICGAIIKTAGLTMVRRLDMIRNKLDANFAIIGMGGVLTPEDYQEYRKAGADVVQSATGAMWNPYLAYEIWEKNERP